jgi:hypothetical protein
MANGFFATEEWRLLLIEKRGTLAYVITCKYALQ